MADRLLVGVVVGAHGVRGAVRIKSFTADPGAVATYGPVEDDEGGRRFSLRVLSVGKGVVTAAVDGVGDRDAAEALRGTRLYVPRAALPATTDEDEFYHADLIGLAAVAADGGPVGRVSAVHDFGAGDVLEIARSSGEAIMLPFTRERVPLVDLAGGRVVVEVPAEIEARPEDEG